MKTLLRVSLASAVLAGSLLTVAAPAFAVVQKEAFSEARFDTLKAANALILVDVAADWCPTCARQHEVLDAYAVANPKSTLHILAVDFDEQKQYVKAFRAPRQSTFVLYRGNTKLWFSVAETRQEVIFAELDKAGGKQ